MKEIPENNNVYNFDLNINEIIDILEKNSGYHWGLIENSFSGSTFGILFQKDNKATIVFGDRFLQKVISDKKTNCLWNALYHNCGELYIGKLHPEQKLRLLKIEDLQKEFDEEIDKIIKSMRY